MLRSTGLLILCSLLAQALGLLLQIVLAHRFGTGVEVDAYVVALTLPGLVEAFVLAAVTQLLLPVLVRRLTDRREGEAWSLLSSLLTILCGGLLALSVPVALGREALAAGLAPGLPPATRALAGAYLAALYPGLALGVAAALLTQALQAQRRFVAPALAGTLAQTIPLAAVIWFSPAIGLWSLIGGTIAAKAVVLVPLVVLLRRGGARLRPRADFRDPELRRMALLAIPVLVAAASARMNAVVDRFFVSFLGAGKLAALGYADRVLAMVLAVLVSPVIAVLYPALADCEARGDRQGLFEAVDRGLRAVIAGMVPFTVALCVLAGPALRLLFEHGRFSDADTRRVAAILLCYAGILILGGVGSLLVRGFYAVGNARDPMIWGGLLPLGLNVVLDALLFRRFDVYGVAAATSLNAAIGLPILYVILRRRLEARPLGGWRSFLARAAAAGGLAAAVTQALAAAMPTASQAGGLAALALAAAAGLGSYGAAAWLLRLGPAREISMRLLSALRARRVALTGVAR